MPKIKRIISEKTHPVDKKSTNDIAQQAMYIPLDDELHSKIPGSEDMKWDQVGRSLFGATLNELGSDLPKTQHDTKTNPSS